MTSSNIYVPYPTPQDEQQLQADVSAIVYQPGVPQELQDQYTNMINSSQFVDGVNEAEANSDLMANE
jgi:hypothetical protein